MAQRRPAPPGLLDDTGSAVDRAESVEDWCARIVSEHAAERTAPGLLTPAERREAAADPIAFFALVCHLELRGYQVDLVWELLEPGGTNIEMAAKGYGKTTIMERTDAWAIGTVADYRGLYLGPKATDSLVVVADMITGEHEEARRYREVFPHVRKATGDVARWVTGGKNAAIMVERAGPARRHKDPTLQAHPFESTEYQGGRFTHIRVDDPTNKTDARSATTRRSRVSTMDGGVTSRTTRRDDGGGWTNITVLCNAWHPQDLGHVLGARPEWTLHKRAAGRRVPMLDDHGQPLLDDHGRDRHEWVDLIWPPEEGGYLPEDLESEYRKMGPYMGPAMLLCTPPGELNSRVLPWWLSRAEAAGVAAEVAAAIRRGIETGWYGWAIRSGVDLAFSTAGRGDYDAIGTAGAPPSPITCRITYERDGADREETVTISRILLDVQQGHWRGDEVIARLSALAARYGRAWGCLVERNNAKHFLEAAEGALPGIQSRQTTAGNKWDDSTGVEAWLGALARGEWGICPSPASGDLVLAAQGFSPHEHTPDSMIATWLAAEALWSPHTTAIDYDRLPAAAPGTSSALWVLEN